MRAIYIMWLRQIKQFWRSKPRIFGSLAQPLLFLIALGFGLGSVFEQAGQGDYIQFLAPGIIGMTILFGSIFNGISVIWDRQFGFLKETLVAPVSRTKLLLGRTLGGATIATFQGIIVLLISLFIGFSVVNWFLFPIALAFMFMTALLFNLLGTAIASKLRDMQAFPLIVNFLIMPLFFLSGALFPLNNIPGFLETIVRINPFSYSIDGLRGAFGGVSHFGMAFDFGILVVLNLVVLFVGKRFFEKIEA